MSENTIIAKFIDEFEAEQKRVLQLDPRERGMQAHYSRVMIVVYDMREFLRKRIDVPAIHPLKVDMASAPMAAQTAPVNVPNPIQVLRNAMNDIEMPIGERHALVAHFTNNWNKAIAAPSSPIAANSEDEKDAQRWRETLLHIGGTHTDTGAQRFTLRYLSPVEGADIMRGSVAGHFTEAIDAAIAATHQKKEGE